MLLTIGQIIGFIAMAIIVISYQQKSHKHILTFQMVSGLLFTVHYILLGAYTGAIMNLLGAFRSLVYANRGKKWASGVVWPIVFSIGFLISGIFTWNGIFSIFPMIAMLMSSVVLWIEQPKINRMFSLPTSTCWLIYNIKEMSIAGIVTEVFVLTSIIIGILRLDIKRKEKK
ncbi:MAG: YgjV family protein [Ruminococcaceae bacterium]|nr:YgjV family protein [Oscillospiraceae bacterium]